MSRRPCAECPWRIDTPPGQFPPERYEALRGTTGSRGREAPLGAPMFGCHKSPEGEEFYCAGWLAAVGYEHIGVRVLVAHGEIPVEAMTPGQDWPDLYESYDALFAVHGVESGAVVKIIGQQGQTRFLIDAGEVDGLPAARVYDAETDELGEQTAIGSITAHSPGWEEPTASDALLENVRERVAALS